MVRITYELSAKYQVGNDEIEVTPVIVTIPVIRTLRGNIIERKSLGLSVIDFSEYSTLAIFPWPMDLDALGKCLDAEVWPKISAFYDSRIDRILSGGV